MVLIAGREAIQQGFVYKKKQFISVSLGIFCIIIPIICLAIDPLLLLARTKLKIIKGGLVHEILKMEYKGLHIKIYVFNITNGDKFLSGEDYKLKLEEVGPFVYQEYRQNEDVDIIPEEGVFRYTPKMWPVFVPNESVADPRNVILNVPNVPLVSITTMIYSFPPIVKNMYNLVTIQQNSKAIVKKDVHSFLWNYTDPLISTANRIVPGLIYFENIGIFERLYDNNMIYRMELGATEEDKFSIKWVDKKMKSHMLTSSSIMESNKSYVNTYEGMGFPPDLPPSSPRHVFRQGICKTLEIQYVKDVLLDINTMGQAFDYSNNTFVNKHLCDTMGRCPHGLMDLSECFFGIPVTISKGHFRDADPILLERIEGLNPDAAIHDTYFHVEPKIGLIIKGRTSLQLNMVMRDMRYSSRLYRFTDMVLPMVRAEVETPELPEIIQSKLEMLYITCYKVQIVVYTLMMLIGLVLLARAIRLFYLKWSLREKTILFEKVPNPNGSIEAVIYY